MDETAPAETGERLSRAEWAVLEKCVRTLSGVGRFNGRNRRAVHAVCNAGLAQVEDVHDLGYRMSVHVRITDKGREALSHGK